MWIAVQTIHMKFQALFSLKKKTQQKKKKKKKKKKNTSKFHLLQLQLVLKGLSLK